MRLVPDRDLTLDWSDLFFEMAGEVAVAAEPAMPALGLAGAAEFEFEDEGLDGSADAIPWFMNRAAPTPTATAMPPIHRAFAPLPHTRQL